MNRIDLGFLPTPLVQLNRLSRRLPGPRLLMKRDDQTGLAFGGNKTRKLEYLLGDALASDCDLVLTAGAAQSNHCRQTAAAAAALGLECHLLLGGQAPPTPEGNLLLDILLGATIHWTGTARKGEQLMALARQLMQQGRRPYVIPYGGSNSVGACGFVQAIAELNSQLEEMGVAPTHLVFASSSGGTQAGLMVGAKRHDLRTTLIGIGIDKDEKQDVSLAAQIVRLANETSARLGDADCFAMEDVRLNNDYLGGGYGVVGPRERRAIRLLAETEGILLDPVYTGRAMGGLIDMIEQGRFSREDTVLFWHTGGSPALFPYAADLLADA